MAPDTFFRLTAFIVLLVHTQPIERPSPVAAVASARPSVLWSFQKNPSASAALLTTFTVVGTDLVLLELVPFPEQLYGRPIPFVGLTPCRNILFSSFYIRLFPMRCAMDPISATTTVITLATFLTDLLSLGQSIRRSFEKVKANRRLILTLTEDILCTLAKLHELTVGRENDFLVPHLVRALEDLKADMLHAFSLTDRLAAAGRKHDLRRFGVRFRIWLRRHDIELAIKSVNEHVHKCFLEFTAFSVARTEYTALRIEHAITAQKVENSMDLRRIEGVMAKLAQETQFGNEVIQRAAGTISSVAAHQSFPSLLSDELALTSTHLGKRGHGTATASSELNGARGHILTLREKPKIMELVAISIQTMLLILGWMIVGIFSPLLRKFGEVSTAK